MLSASLELLPDVRRNLRHNATVSFHTGAAEAMAKVRLLEKEELRPGEATWVQLSLSKPVAVVNGDHFIIRSSTDTLGGGKVVDAHARRLRRFRPAIIENLKARDEGTAEDTVMALLETKQPLELPAILAQSDLPSDGVQPVIESLARQGKVIKIGQGERCLLFTADGWERLTRKATDILQDYHRKFPSRAGMPRVELSSRLKLGGYSSAVWHRFSEEGVIAEEGGSVRLPGHSIQLTAAQRAKIDAFLRSMAQNPYSPPSELVPEADLLNLLIEQGRVVKVSDSVVFATSAYNDMVEKVTDEMKMRGKITLAEVRDLFQTSRKYAQAFLEHLDQRKITRRVGDERVPYQ